jgi:integrase
LIPILRRIGKKLVRELTPQFIRQLAKEMLPYASTDTWMREVVTPVRSVINNAHELGKCPPIRVRRFSKAEMVKQDNFRGKQSRLPKTPGSWPWVLAFMEKAEPRDAALAYFMFRHGYRLSQSISMTRSKDLDISAGKVRVHASKGHPAHWVDLDPEEVAMIASLPRPYRGQARDRVFTIAGGRSGALYRRWKAACAAAGIDYLPPHSCGRHGYGTEMVVRQNGKVDIISASEDKWSDPSVMLKTYSHTNNAAAKVRDAFMDGLRAARTPAVQTENGNEAESLAAQRRAAV